MYRTLYLVIMYNANRKSSPYRITWRWRPPYSIPANPTVYWNMFLLKYFFDSNYFIALQDYIVSSILLWKGSMSVNYFEISWNSIILISQGIDSFLQSNWSDLIHQRNILFKIISICSCTYSQKCRLWYRLPVNADKICWRTVCELWNISYL